MNNLINELKKIPYSEQDILNILDGKTKIITYKDLRKYSTIDELLRPYDNVVLLYETKTNYGHWTCLMKRGNKIEFFDPYGNEPDYIMDLIPKKNRNKLGYDYPRLSKLLVDSKYDIVYNSKQLQKMNKDTSNCGRYVSLRLIMQDYSLDEFIKMLKDKNISSDDLVTYLTAFN